MMERGGLTILLVEDDPLDGDLSRIELEHFGHRVTLVPSGEMALELYPEVLPDLVVTDLRLPGMDGCELTRALKAQCHPHWLPVLFLSGLQAEKPLVEAYQAGADDFIAKPVSRPVLGAKLQSFQRRILLQRQALAREKLLQRYRDQAEEEKGVAQHLMHRLVNAELLGDLAVSHWMRPAETYSGDLIAAARTPGGVLHVLLADATGHGLAASLAVMPVTQPFYRMTEKGFGLDTIAREMNRKVRELLPTGRFVAATLASIDSSTGSIQVWNGGNPPPLLISSRDQLVDQVFGATHLPLGILEDEAFDAAPETHFIQGPHQLVIYSDGVVEAENADGVAFGQERLRSSLLGHERESRLSSVVSQLDQHLGDQPARDDLSLLLVHCYHQTPRAPRIAQNVSRALRNTGNWQVAMTLSAEELRAMDPVPMLMGVINQFNYGRVHSSQVFLILSELFNNALDHGILRLDSSLKCMSDGFERYLEERQRRLAQLQEGCLEVGVEQLSEGGNVRLRIRVKDSGPGFPFQELLDYLVATGAGSRVSDCSSGAPHGRGIQLVSSLCSDLRFCGAGNEVIAYYDAIESGLAGDGQ